MICDASREPYWQPNAVDEELIDKSSELEKNNFKDEYRDRTKWEFERRKGEKYYLFNLVIGLRYK